MPTDQQTVEQAIIGEHIIAVPWLPDISVRAPFDMLDTFELQSVTLEGETKLILSPASGYEEVLAEIEESKDVW